MTIDEIAAKLDGRVLSGTADDLKKEVSGVYSCDLLSHAMAKINRGDVWVTVHTNLNVVAVASLTETACVFIPENIFVEEQTIAKANEKGVVFISSPESAAMICHKLITILGIES